MSGGDDIYSFYEADVVAGNGGKSSESSRKYPT
jgi:hypothetical protein